jgi:hypothetical protein
MKIIVNKALNVNAAMQEKCLYRGTNMQTINAIEVNMFYMQNK